MPTLQQVVPAISLRDAEPRDAELLLALYASAREPELAAFPWPPAQRDAFLRMQHDLRSRAYAERFPGARDQIVEVDGRFAGRMLTHSASDELRLVDVALLPEARGRGVGTQLLTQLLDGARQAGRRVVLHVELGSPARALYERMGFAGAIDPDLLHQRMEWQPAEQHCTP